MRGWIFLISVLLAFNFMMNFYTTVTTTCEANVWFYLFLGFANLVAFVYAMIKAIKEG